MKVLCFEGTVYGFQERFKGSGFGCKERNFEFMLWLGLEIVRYLCWVWSKCIFAFYL